MSTSSIASKPFGEEKRKEEVVKIIMEAIVDGHASSQEIKMMRDLLAKMPTISRISLLERLYNPPAGEDPRKPYVGPSSRW